MATVTFEGGARAWRIADGKIVRGRGRGGEEELSIAYGKLVRVGVHEGETDDGEHYKKVECDLETDDGIESIGCAIRDGNAANVAPFQFAVGLLECAKGETIALKAERSKEPHERYGTYTTFVNVGIVNPQTLKAKAVKPDKTRFPGDSCRDKLPHVLKELEEHPAWAPRPARDGGGESFFSPPELQEFEATIAEKGWPKLGEAEGVYLSLCGKVAGGQAFDNPSDVPASVWAEMAKAARTAKKMPPPLEAWVKSSGWSAAEYDPFADV